MLYPLESPRLEPECFGDHSCGVPRHGGCPAWHASPLGASTRSNASAAPDVVAMGSIRGFSRWPRVAAGVQLIPLIILNRRGVYGRSPLAGMILRGPAVVVRFAALAATRIAVGRADVQYYVTTAEGRFALLYSGHLCCLPSRRAVFVVHHDSVSKCCPPFPWSDKPTCRGHPQRVRPTLWVSTACCIAASRGSPGADFSAGVGLLLAQFLGHPSPPVN